MKGYLVENKEPELDISGGSSESHVVAGTYVEAMRRYLDYMQTLYGFKST